MMNTVRGSTKTTVSLIAFFFCFVMLTNLLKTLPYEFVYKIQITFSKQHKLSSFFQLIQKLAIWSLFFAGVEYVIIRDYWGLQVFRGFYIPLIICGITAIGANISVIRFHWFWASYSVLLLIGIVLSYKRISALDVIDTSVYSLVKTILNKTLEDRHLDDIVVQITKVSLGLIFLLLFFLTVAFIFQNSNSFIMVQ